jgi:hypothetical protein
MVVPFEPFKGKRPERREFASELFHVDPAPARN